MASPAPGILPTFILLMSQITIEDFEQAVARYFVPIAQEHGWSCIRRAPTVYEIPSPHFVMRIRFDVGAHRRSINALLLPKDQMPGDIENGGEGELGIAVIAGYNGVTIESIPWDWDQNKNGLLGQAQYVAAMVREHGLPYLTGKKSDWPNVVEFISKRIEERSEHLRKIKFPPNVQKRWHLPPPPAYCAPSEEKQTPQTEPTSSSQVVNEQLGKSEPQKRKRPLAVILSTVLLGFYSLAWFLAATVIPKQFLSITLAIQFSLVWGAFFCLLFRPRTQVARMLTYVALAMIALKGLLLACSSSLNIPPLPPGSPLTRIFALSMSAAIAALFWCFAFGKRSREYYLSIPSKTS